MVAAHVGRQHAGQGLGELARRQGPEQTEQQKPCTPTISVPVSFPHGTAQRQIVFNDITLTHPDHDVDPSPLTGAFAHVSEHAVRACSEHLCACGSVERAKPHSRHAMYPAECHADNPKRTQSEERAFAALCSQSKDATLPADV